MSGENNPQQGAMEQQINEMIQQSRVLEAYMNDIITREAAVTRLIQEARLASGALQNMEEELDMESLTPIGIGVYLRSFVPPVRTLLINIGAGVTIEKSRQDTLNYIEAKMKEFEVASRQLNNQKHQISIRMEQIQAQVNELLQKTMNSQSGSGRRGDNPPPHSS
jgi:prefoldin alpha subunit